MRKRRGRGEGSIFRRQDGSWCGVLTVGYTEHGARRRRYIYAATKGEVTEHLTRLQHAALTGALGDSQRLTVSAYLTRWLEDAARPAVRATTYALYAGLIRLHIAPRIGGVILAKLDPAHVQHLLSEMEKAGASARTRQKVYRVLHRALHVAMQWGLTSRNASQAVTCPRAPRPQVQALTPEQASRLVEAAQENRLGALYTLAVTTGMRQGELFGLQWEDVDVKARAVFVHYQLCELSGKLWLAPPKTKAAQRRVDLPEIAVRALQEHRRRMLAEGYVHADGFVFCDERGGPLRKSNVVRRSFFPLLKTAGLPRIRFHALRHTAASLLLTRGVHPKMVQALLGHAQIGITLDVYSHLIPSLGRDTAAAMDAVLAPHPEGAVLGGRDGTALYV